LNKNTNKKKKKCCWNRYLYFLKKN
jgi:hypothetical protein